MNANIDTESESPSKRYMQVNAPAGVSPHHIASAAAAAAHAKGIRGNVHIQNLNTGHQHTAVLPHAEAGIAKRRDPPSAGYDPCENPASAEAIAACRRLHSQKGIDEFSVGLAEDSIEDH